MHTWIQNGILLNYTTYNIKKKLHIYNEFDCFYTVINYISS